MLHKITPRGDSIIFPERHRFQQKRLADASRSSVSRAVALVG
jgi:hypothetical protein